jgi:N5-(cytidine 5'-diphosphoramidyl)-L-glutamine hydrolase
MINSFSNFVVGVTQRVDEIADRNEFRDAVDQKLLKWLVSLGYYPVTIPNILSSSDVTEEQTMLKKWLINISPNALVLSGGNNIGDFSQRDVTEKTLLSWARTNNIPVLGICRGLQMMAVWAGASLVKREGHVNCRHNLIVNDMNNGEWPVSVNSYHDWVVESCPDGFEVTAKSEDGVIEAIKHIKLPWEGWMWHPEREDDFSEIDNKRLKRLFIEQ